MKVLLRAQTTPPLAAGELMYRAALANPALKPEAAELFRRAKLYARALALRGQARDGDAD